VNSVVQATVRLAKAASRDGADNIGGEAGLADEAPPNNGTVNRGDMPAAG
jgi:hypothetical protein